MPGALAANTEVQANQAPQTASNESNSSTSVEVAPAKQVDPKQAALNAQTANGMRRIGVNVSPQQLNSSGELPPITGFHPIKRALRPVVQLEHNSVELQKQIMRLEGPIAGLQGPMVGLQKKMNGVEQKMVDMKGAIGSMQTQVGSADSGMSKINQQMDGVRSDLKTMQRDICELRKPITDLQKPLHALEGPLTSVSEPLREVYKQLGEMKTLLTMVLFAIMAGAMATAIGTPIAAVVIWRNRRKLFPHMNDHDFPVAKASDKVGEKPVEKDQLTRV